MKLVVIISAYNEERSISKVIKAIPKVNDRISKTEVIVIDDGSNDRTKEIAEESGAVVVSHNGNRVVGAAFRTGIEEALKRKADVIVNMDGDGQFNPKDIPKLIEPILDKEADFGIMVSLIYRYSLNINLSDIFYF